MPTSVISKYFESLVLRVEQKVNAARDVSTGGMTPADAAYFGNPSQFLPTATVTINPGVNTLTGNDEINFLAWQAANPNSPFLLNNTIYSVISTPTGTPATFPVAT